MKQDNLLLEMAIRLMINKNTYSTEKPDIKQVNIVLSIEQHAFLHIVSNRESDVILKEMADTISKDKSDIM